jgi:DNA-directed DNA polymerase III (polc)
MYLNVHSYYSLHYGTMSIQNLVARAKSYGFDTLPLTDINTTMGAVEFFFECKKHGLNPVLGAEFRNGNELLFVALAKSNKGFSEINSFLTKHNLSKQPFPAVAPEWNDVFVIYPFGKRDVKLLKYNEFLGIRFVQLSRLYNCRDFCKMVMLQPATFFDEKEFYVHKNLRAIDGNILFTRLQVADCAAEDEIFISQERLKAAYVLYPDLIAATERLLGECSIHFDQSIKNKRCFTGNAYDDLELLRKLAFDGMKYRYGMSNKEAYRRIEKELGIIEKMNFCAYFLMAWDVVRYASSCGFYHVGRGSGANSIVAYCLKITDVDPMELDLYFERFLNPKRTSPPDFDLDFSWRDRDAVIDYIFKRYGREHVALLGVTVTFQGRSICRELGKVHGLPKNEIDALVRNPNADLSQNKVTRHILELSRYIFDFPSQRSIHAGGVLISENPISCYAALDLPPKGFPTTQWDMCSAELIGFEKIDILSQRGIGHIKDAVDIVRQNRGIDIDIHQVEKFKGDPKVKRQLETAETNGCFYIESPAMRGLLHKLHCSDYKTLVAASSIMRPGVAKSGMMREYVNRFRHPESVDYRHPILKEQLSETYGVMVYQEDVLKVCHYFAGLDLADADVLRRMMSHKKRDDDAFQLLTRKFFNNCKSKGYPDELAKEIWRQIESFASYSFSKAHSASYAVESFQSLFLKTYFPLEFQVAVINNFGGFYNTWVYFNEAKRYGATVHLPCVNNSIYLTSLKEKTVYMGFVHLLGVEKQFVEYFVKERDCNGPFKSLSDFVQRTAPKLEQLILLVRCGAFGFTSQSKPQLLWEAYTYKNRPQTSSDSMLFETLSMHFRLPNFEVQDIENVYDEMELLGFPVTMSHFDLLQTHFRGELLANQMLQGVGRKFKMLGKLVTIKYVWTSKGELMHFASFVDYTGEFFDTVHFPDVLKAYPFHGEGIYLLLGKIVEEFGHPFMEVEKMAKMPLKPDPRGV